MHSGFIFLSVALAVLAAMLAIVVGILRRRLNAAVAQYEDFCRNTARNEEKYRSLVELAADAILVGTPEGRIAGVNSAACALFGLSDQQILGKHIGALPWQPDSLRSTPFDFEGLNRGGVLTVNRVVCQPSGVLVPVEMRSRCMPDGRYQSIIRDITFRLQNEEILRNKEENLKVTLDSIGDGVIVVDVGGRVQRLNPVAVRLTGWGLDDALGRELLTVYRIVRAENRAPVALPDLQTVADNPAEGHSGDIILLSREGGERRIAHTIAPIRSVAGQCIGMVLVFRDMTEEYALQESLRRSQKLEAIGTLAGGIAHDINNILGGIMGAADLIGLRLTEAPSLRQYVQIITESSARASELTQKLLTFALKSPMRFALLDAHTVLREVLQAQERTLEGNIVLHLELMSSSALISADAAQLKNVFCSLCMNAVQAMPEGGELVVRTSMMTLDERYCGSSPFELRPGSYMRVDICDTGCGIPPENMARLFEPFFTTRKAHKGEGLGLSAVYGVVLQHKGAITVDSEVGIGTSIHVMLPLECSAVPDAPQATAVQRGVGRILLVDDEQLIQFTIGAILEKLGYEVVLASNGREGLAKFQQNPRTFDLVILDMLMPEMSGRECFSAMQKIRPEVKVILASGFSVNDEVESMKAEGLKAYIHKPFRIAELSAAVHAALND